MWSEIIYAPGIKINWKWANLQPFHTSFYFLELQTNICSHSFLDLSNMILRFIPVGACCTKISFNFLTLFQRPLFPLSGPMTDTEAVLVKVGFCLTTRLWMWSRSVGKWIFSNRCICVPLKARFQFPTKRNIDKVIVFFKEIYYCANCGPPAVSGPRDLSVWPRDSYSFFYIRYVVSIPQICFILNESYCR